MAKKKTVAFLEKGLQATGNEYASVVKEGLQGDVKEWNDTGSYTLNALLCGSLFGGSAGNKTLVFAGEQSTGKTYLTIGVVKNYLDNHPDGIVYIWDSEFAMTSDMLISRGVDASRCVVLPVATIQEFRTQSLKLMDDYLALAKEERPPMLLVLDSLGMLSSTKELEDSTGGKETADMTKAKLAKSVVRTLTPKLGKAGVSMIMTNHTYDVIGSYVPMKKMGGGSGPMYAASTIIFLSKSKVKDEETKQVTGHIITCRAEKSRFTREQSKCQILLDFGTGVDRYYGLLELGEKHALIIRDKNKYILPGGVTVSKKQLLENPEEYYTKEVLTVLEAAAQAEYSYGSNIPEDETEEVTAE